MSSVLPPPPTRGEQGGFAWTSWYNQLYTLLSTSGSVAWSLIDKAGSSIADLQTKNHNLLTSMQGGTSGEYYHLTQADYNTIHTPTLTYGSVYDTTSQTVSAANTATAVTFNNTKLSSNVSVGSPTSRIVVATTGVFLILVDFQFSKANASTSLVDFWFRKNGTDIANSGSTLTLSGNGVLVSVTHELMENLTANDYIEVMFSSSDSAMSVTYTAAGASPTRPAVPSVLINIEQIR